MKGVNINMQAAQLRVTHGDPDHTRYNQTFKRQSQRENLEIRKKEVIHHI